MGADIRGLLHNLDALFGLGMTKSDLETLVKNNEFFVECGVLAVEISERSPPKLTWDAFARHWWRRVRTLELISSEPSELLKLAYLTYASKQFGVFGLPTSLKTVITLKRCGFPGCSETDGLHEDHVWPKSLGGPDFRWNIQSLCERHNRMKSNYPGLNFCDPSLLRSALAQAFK